jgi:putative transcriptional regulator
MADRFQTGARNNYEGKLLVAHPNLGNFFHRTVIFVYQDDENSGTLGLVLNKPTRITVADVVTENAVFLLHEDQWYGSNTMQIGNSGLAITSDNVMMEKLSMGNYPLGWRMCTGVAAWRPGQLQQEMSSIHGWLTCDANRAIVFNKDGDRQWNNSLQLCANQKIDSYF